MQQMDFIASYNDIEIELKAYFNDLQFIYRNDELIDVSFKSYCTYKYLKEKYNINKTQINILLKYFNDNLKVVECVKNDLIK